jgi:hypothetical protein
VNDGGQQLRVIAISQENLDNRDRLGLVRFRQKTEQRVRANAPMMRTRQRQTLQKTRRDQPLVAAKAQKNINDLGRLLLINRQVAEQNAGLEMALIGVHFRLDAFTFHDRTPWTAVAPSLRSY